MAGSDHRAAVRNKLEAAFGGELSAEQIEAVVAFAKLVRFRARNNAALPNLCSSVFPHARFRNVPKHGYRGTYQALEINIRGVAHVEAEAEESEAA